MTARPIVNGLAQAGVLLAAGAILKYAEHIHAVGPDVATRAIQVIIGLYLAFLGNFIPKRLSASGRIHTAQRIAGWAFVIAGLGYATLWALAPQATADVVSTAMVASATIVTLGYAIWACTMRPRTGNAQTGQ